jgi:hypothetical protein
LFRPFGDLRDLLPLHAQSLGHTAYRHPGHQRLQSI